MRISAAYFYDIDGDEGATPGFFGILFLGHDTDPLGEVAPKRVGINLIPELFGDQPYENGRRPEQRFPGATSSSAKTTRDRNQEVPRDYRMLLAGRARSGSWRPTARSCCRWRFAAATASRE